jgi:alpha-aminoadipate carrier protein LysW
MSGKVKTLAARCPDCDEIIRPRSNPRIGQKLSCSVCDAELEVVGINPLELEWAIDDDYDDDDDDDWDDDSD